MIEYCVCGHVRKKHKVTPAHQIYFCMACYRATFELDPIFKHKFKLDNLKLIEDTAKKRNLI